MLSSCMFFLHALFLSIKFLFQLVFTRFLHHLLNIIFNYLQIFLYERQGSINTALEERFLILFYLFPFWRFSSLFFSRTLSFRNNNGI